MKNTNILLRSTIAILLALTGPAVATTVSWDGGGGDDDWANPLNWTGDTVPLPGDTVYTDGADVTARSVTVDAGGEYYLQSFTGSVDTLAVGAEGVGWAEVANAALDCDILQIGLLEGSSGAMQVETMDAGRVSVGASGLGFLQLDGQMSSHAGALGLFHRAGGDVLITQFGRWTCDDLVVGLYGNGNLTLEPGAEVVATTAIIGFAEGTSSSASLSNGARLEATDALLVGYSGAGSLNVTNAAQVACGIATIGGTWELMDPGTGVVTLADSDMTVAGDLFVGESGAGSLTASQAAEIDVNDVYVGYMPGAAGDMTLDGAARMQGTNAFIGGYGQGSVSLLASSRLLLDGRLYLGYLPGGNGVLSVGDDAYVEADEVYLGGEAVEGNLQSGDEVGLLRRDGCIEVNGIAYLRCMRGFHIGACGAMDGAISNRLDIILEPGAGFTNASIDAAALNGLTTASLICVAGEGTTTIEVAAADDLPGVPQMDLSGRFAVGTLYLHADAAAMLVNETDNQLNGGPAEALYVHTLALGAGSTLDLNGLSLYYRTLVDEGGTVILNGGTLASIYPAGDIDGDGDVDLDDFAILKANFGTASGATRAQGDMNGDGVVDLDDFMVLKQNFGYVQPS